MTALSNRCPLTRLVPTILGPITISGIINTYLANFPSDGNQSFPIIMIMIGLLSSGDLMQGIASSSQKNSKRKPKDKLVFDAQAFLDSAGVSRKVIQYRKSQKIYSQGAPATSVIYIQEGGVKLSVVNEVGKEAVVAILGPADFIGEGAWQARKFAWGQPPRLGSRSCWSS